MNTKNICITGVGGQGTLFAGKILGAMAKAAGHQVKISEVHGMAQRGGSVVTHIRYGTQVYAPVVEAGQADLLLAFEELEALRYAHFLKGNGLLLVYPCCVKPAKIAQGEQEYPKGILTHLKKNYRVCCMDKQETEKNLNMLMLGAAADYLGFSQKEGLCAIAENVQEKTFCANKAAFMQGYEFYEKEKRFLGV